MLKTIGFDPGGTSREDAASKNIFASCEDDADVEKAHLSIEDEDDVDKAPQSNIGSGMWAGRIPICLLLHYFLHAPAAVLLCSSCTKKYFLRAPAVQSTYYSSLLSFSCTTSLMLLLLHYSLDHATRATELLPSY